MTYEEYYWLGYLLDGVKSTDESYIVKLTPHTHKIARYIEEAPKQQLLSEIATQYENIYSLGSSPRIFFSSDDNLIAFFIGYVDGNFSFSFGKNSLVQLSREKHWLEILSTLYYTICKLVNVPHKELIVNKNNKCRMSLANKKVLYFLRDKAKQMNLPIDYNKLPKVQ